jgi:hypothetical protein
VLQTPIAKRYVWFDALEIRFKLVGEFEVLSLRLRVSHFSLPSLNLAGEVGSITKAVPRPSLGSNH